MTITKASSTPLLALAIVAVVTPAAAHGVSPRPAHAGYEVRDLGTLGGTLSGPTDLNSHGAVVGVSSNPGDTALRGFVWRHGVMTDIGDFGGPQAAAASINSAGQVAGWGDLATAAPPSIFNTTSLFCNPPMVAAQPAVVC